MKRLQWETKRIKCYYNYNMVLESSTTQDEECVSVDTDFSLDIDEEGIIKSEKEEKRKKKKKEKEKKKKDKVKSSSKVKHPPRSKESEDGFSNAFPNRSSKDNDIWASFDQADFSSATNPWQVNNVGWDTSFDTSARKASHLTQTTIASTFDGIDHNFKETKANETNKMQPASNKLNLVPGKDDPEAVASFHSDMLQGFMKRNGEDEKVAVATASAFQHFLKQQHDILNKIQGDTNEDDFDFENDDEEFRLDCLESMAEDAMGDSFAPDSTWEDGSIFFEEKAKMMAEYFKHDEKLSEKASSPPKAIFGFDEKAQMMADFMEDEKNLKSNSDSEEDAEDLAAYHAEMLQGFLQRQGKGDAIAEQTAMAFQHFLFRQQDALSKLSGGEATRSGSFADSRGAFSEPVARLPSHRNTFPTFITQRATDDSGLPQSMMPLSDHIGKSSIHSAHSNSCDESVSRRSRLLVGGQSVRSGFSTITDHSSNSYRERSIQEQLADLTNSQIACLDAIRKQAKGRYNDALCLRFARCSGFKSKVALKVMQKFVPNKLLLSIADMETLLRSMLIYPLTGVVGRGGVSSK
jgi:hypothetical protein